MGFGLNLKILTLSKMVSLERECQEEQNDADFSSVASSSEKLWLLILASDSNVHVRGV